MDQKGKIALQTCSIVINNYEANKSDFFFNFDFTIVYFRLKQFRVSRHENISFNLNAIKTAGSQKNNNNKNKNKTMSVGLAETRLFYTFA